MTYLDARSCEEETERLGKELEIAWREIEKLRKTLVKIANIPFSEFSIHWVQSMARDAVKEVEE